MAGNNRRRLKTLVGAGSYLYAANDSRPLPGIKRAVELARKAEAQKITGLFTADLLQADPAGLAGSTGSQDPLITDHAGGAQSGHRAYRSGRHGVDHLSAPL